MHGPGFATKAFGTQFGRLSDSSRTLLGRLPDAPRTPPGRAADASRARLGRLPDTPRTLVGRLSGPLRAALRAPPGIIHPDASRAFSDVSRTLSPTPLGRGLRRLRCVALTLLTLSVADDIGSSNDYNRCCFFFLVHVSAQTVLTWRCSHDFAPDRFSTIQQCFQTRNT